MGGAHTAVGKGLVSFVLPAATFLWPLLWAGEAKGPEKETSSS